MHREYHRWFSPTLQREMELLIFGHGGARVLVFPTSKGKYYEWEDRGMVGALADQVDRGGLQLYCVDSVDAESWYCDWAHPGGRAWRHQQYDDYLYHEVLPLSEHKNGNPFLMTVGASFGAYHAVNFGLRHPDKVSRVIAMSGLYDIRRFTSGFHNETIFLNNPVEYIAQEHDGERLNLLRRMDIILATGKGDSLIASARQMSAVLWSRGVGNALREWDGWSHDWQYWQQMMRLYIGGHD